MRTGTATLPLHDGRCPPWLFRRMTALAGAVAEAIVEEFSPATLLERLADPGWFQAFGAVLGFDWHSSGLTTVTAAALKAGLADRSRHLGVFVAGGKGAHARRTPDEIRAAAESGRLRVDPEPLVATSRLVAKVDNAAVQDGYQLYHHVFVFTAEGRWAVIQQGMPSAGGSMARRYHWLSDHAADPVAEPHTGIVGDAAAVPEVLDLTAGASAAVRAVAPRLVREVPWAEVSRGLATLRAAHWTYAAAHAIPRAALLDRLLLRLYDRPPADFRDLLLTEGIGPGSLRALVMVAEMIYGVRAARTDPVRYSFAHGGKDGHPYPVDRAQYDRSIAVLERALERARRGQPDALAALRRLARWRPPPG